VLSLVWVLGVLGAGFGERVCCGVYVSFHDSFGRKKNVFFSCQFRGNVDSG
jgi:hypothetical protein